MLRLTLSVVFAAMTKSERRLQFLTCHAPSYTEKTQAKSDTLFPSQTYCMFQKIVQFPNAINVNFISAGLGSKH